MCLVCARGLVSRKCEVDLGFYEAMVLLVEIDQWTVSIGACDEFVIH
jgi:hypothetical protein